MANLVATGRFRNAIYAPLVGESRLVGTILVANRLSDLSPFDSDDLKLFQTLASHTAIALENGQLEQSLSSLSGSRTSSSTRPTTTR